jgi:tetratricopeptide (TPR) repeat protein
LLQTLNPDDFPPVDPAAAHDDPSKAVRKAVADDTVHISYELRAAGDAGAVLEPLRTVTFQLGEQGVPPALETALFHMRANECAIVDVVRGVAATALRPPKPNEHRFFDAIPADWVDAERATTAERARLDDEEKHVHRRPHWVRPYDDKDVAARMHITLHSIAPESFGWDLSAKEQVEAAAAAKARGAAMFAQERFEQAKRKFKRAITLTEQALRVVPGDDPLHAQASEIALSCHLNIAACLLKLKEYTNVLEATNHALKIDANNVKALFRRAQALVQLHRWDEADELLLAAAHLEPSNKAVRDEIQQMKTRRQEHAAKERTIFTSMFDKLADQEANERKVRLERAAHERVLLEEKRKAADAAAAAAEKPSE